MSAVTESTAALRGQHAVVTGAGTGIGAAIAGELARLGVDLTLMGRDATRLEDRRRALETSRTAAADHATGGRSRVTTTLVDVRDPASVEVAFLAARRFHGEVTILVNNAGVAASAPFARTDRGIWEDMLRTNLTGAYLCTAQVLPGMLGARRGRIVNVASTAGLRGFKYVTAYCASKHGLVGFTRALALETAGTGVTVNAVCPGFADTEMTRRSIATIVERTGRSPEEARSAIERQNLGGRLIRPDEVAAVVARLCLPEAADVNGEAIAIESGEPVASGLASVAGTDVVRR